MGRLACFSVKLSLRMLIRDDKQLLLHLKAWPVFVVHEHESLVERLAKVDC